MDHEPLPTDVRRKLEQATRWLRARDARLAECLETMDVRVGRGVILARPVTPAGRAPEWDPGAEARSTRRGRILVNPAAVRDLPTEVVAGALVSSLLASPPEGWGDSAGRAELLRRAERVRRTLQLA